jgi:predicted methyltransferase
MNDTHHPPRSVYYSDESVQLYHGDCLDVMASLPDASVDAIVTDPPYGLGFMGKEWDALPPGIEWAEQCLRVLKPGGYLLAFGGTRTWHRLVVSVEDAGFEIRDSIAWLYGSGFPKSLDVSKAIDKAAGAEREITREATRTLIAGDTISFDQRSSTERERRDTPVTAAAAWQGWGTALKPAFEPVVVGHKPLIGTVAANVQQHGVGALNIDGCRIGTESRVNPAAGNKAGGASLNMSAVGMPQNVEARETVGRWPANVILDESQAAALDEQSGNRPSGGNPNGERACVGLRGNVFEKQTASPREASKGGASRFFYVAKAPASQRPKVDGVAHPTVKPLDLMRWLVRLVTPPSGTVLDPFLGSGTTAEACIVEGFQCIGIERDETYIRLAVTRLSKPIEPVLDFGVA